MKYQNHLLLTLLFASNAMAAGPIANALNINLIGTPQVSAINLLSPLKKNVLDVDGRIFLLPDYLDVLKGEDGKWKIDLDSMLDHKVGNGGDYLRAQYLLIGRQVISYLEDTEDGQKIVNSRALSLDNLKSILDISKLAVVDDLLIDNTGSVVDAIGVPGLVILNSDSWKEHFEKERNIYYLVFHEMLRAVAVNDDNYVISKAIMNFPLTMRVKTQLVPSVPLIAEDSLASILNNSKITTGGTGCTNKSNRLFSDLNLANNTLELSFYDYVTRLTDSAAFDRKNCSLAIPVTLPANKKLVVSLIDIQGQMETSNPNTTATAKVTFEAFLAGTSQKSQIKTISLNQGKRTFLHRRTNVLSSTCGGESILRLNSNVVLTKTAASPAQVGPTELLQVKKISVYMNLEDCVP